MYLNRISIENFRIFYGKHTFSLENKKLIIVHGLNGHGKSSFFDAIEWCLTGDIQRYVGSAERQKFNYIVHKSLTIQELEENKLDPQASVEVWFKKNKEEYFKIKRIYNIERNIRKPIIINGTKYTTKEGNEKIRKIIINSIIENTNDDFSKIELPTLLASTQFLSQDTIQAFISSKKPQDRYKVIEKVLGMQKYGSEFHQYIGHLNNVVNKKIDEISDNENNNKHKLQNANSVLKVKEEFFNKIGNETEEELLKKININIKANTKFMSKVLPNEITSISIDSQSFLVSYRENLRTYISETENNYFLIQNAESLLSLLDTKIEEEYLHFKSMSNNLDEKKLKYESIQKRLKKGKEQIQIAIELKETYDLKENEYQDLLQLTKKEKDAKELLIEKLIMDNVLENMSYLSDYIEEYLKQISYKEELELYIRLLDLRGKLIFEKDQLKQMESQLYKGILDLNELYADIESLTKQKKELEESFKQKKEDVVEQMINNLQAHILEQNQENHDCPICGTQFENNLTLKKAVESKMQEYITVLDQDSVFLLNTNTKLQFAQVRYEVLYKDIENLEKKEKEIKISIKEKEDLLLEEIPKINSEIQKKSIEEAQYLKSQTEDFIKEQEDNYNVCIIIEKIENNIKVNEAKQQELYKDIENIRNRLGKQSRFLKTSYIAERRIARIERYLLNLSDKIKKIEFELNQCLIQMNNNQNQRTEKAMKIAEIEKVFPNFSVSHRHLLIQNEIKKVNQLRSFDKRLEEQSSKLEAFISSDNIFSLKSSVAELEKEMQKIDSEMRFYSEISGQLNDLEGEHNKIQGDLMNKYLQKYSQKIDELFLQISPHAFFNHVNLISKGNELYVIVSDKKEGDLDLLSLENLETRFNASLTFSSAQSNVLAVCIFLAFALSQEWTPLQTIGIDDPFQNLDDINVFSFLDVLAQVLEQKQVIITTHDDRFVNLMRMKSGLENNEIAEIWMESYSSKNISIRSNCLVAVE